MAESTPESPKTAEAKRSYKDTLNLPKTPFPMKANLVQNEPASMKRWAAEKLYDQTRKARAGAPRFVFHDGPPYANGSIHLGHLLNKVLKDFVVRSRTMMGFDVPYVPGWDCHGLPIEHKVMQDLGASGGKARGMEPFQVRRKCQASAEKFVKLQRGQMERLLTLADYDHPYLTMDPKYEAASLEVFAQLVEKKLVYRALKPVHWSIANQTALAEAELEYMDREDTSVYVFFEVSTGVAETFKSGGNVSEQTKALMGAFLMIWTTTPWTLPANRAVAVNSGAEYGVYEHAGKKIVVACDLAKQVFEEEKQPLVTMRGRELVGIGYTHPFMPAPPTQPGERLWSVVTADYVTLEDGTGLVHTAPGHGVEDYQTALREKIEVYCPVREDGTFDDTVPTWLRQPGVDVWKANDLVVAKLRESGHLFHDHKFLHSYPHDWRSKTPTIFRATEQWFVSVDMPIDDGASLRQRSLQTIKDVTFYPDWGLNRLRGMLETRPDWCISRQRAWGLPIPAFFGDKGEVLLTAASVRAVEKVVAQHGSDVWFKLTPEQLLAEYNPANDPDAPDWIKIANRRSQIAKSSDIFDVWFDSGTSWASVIRRLFGADWLPTDLYLEGSDQHRGWFQASLLPAVATTGKPPYKAVLTHGFMVDKDGKKMSKSLGNTIEVEDLLKELGADVCRWWVASLNVENDIKVDREFFKLAGEEYRKVRNTIRYLLSNLYDFNPRKDTHKFTQEDARSIDAWAMGELAKLVATARGAYERYDFRLLRETLFNFCNDTMSAVYLSATKDRTYCDVANSPRRRRTQTAMFAITDNLVRLLAPILPHTADEAWRHLYSDCSTVHLAAIPEPTNVPVHKKAPELIDKLWRFVVGDLERVRKERDLAPLDCGVLIHIPPAVIEGWDWIEDFNLTDIADLFGVSLFEVLRPDTTPGLLASVGQFGVPSRLWMESPDTARVEIVDLKKAAEKDGDHRFDRCERSWKRDGTVKQRSDGGMLSDRDAAAIGV